MPAARPLQLGALHRRPQRAFGKRRAARRLRARRLRRVAAGRIRPADLVFHWARAARDKVLPAVNRRHFLQLGSALALAPRFALAQAPYVLKAAPAVQHLVGAANPATRVWAYNGTVPGPLLRFRQGERLRIEVQNTDRK